MVRSTSKSGASPQRLGFEVSTHIFDELGRLLVGRDSTALSELIKNAYDADATFVRVYGEQLSNPATGFIRVLDDGIGMSQEEFVQGFLRIASGGRRTKDRRSLRYNRRFTGAKGIGRLAAHKLARVLEVASVAGNRPRNRKYTPFRAVIDWDEIESHELLDAANRSVIVKPVSSQEHKAGTILVLKRLRRAWTENNRVDFAFQALSLQPPDPLIKPVSPTLISKPLLFTVPRVHDTDRRDPGFRIELAGDFDVGEDYWSLVSSDALWIIEAECDGEALRAHIAPTRRGAEKYPDARAVQATRQLFFQRTPLFQARILVREGRADDRLREFTIRNGGVRVYMEGFRVLPYGDPKDDWLDIQKDYTRRANVLGADDELKNLSKEDLLTFLPQERFNGAVFLTESGSAGLEMLVNREGFVDDVAFDALARSVRWSMNIFLRERARTTAAERDQKRAARRTERNGSANKSSGPTPLAFETVASELLQEAKGAVQRAQHAIAEKGPKGAHAALRTLDQELTESLQTYAEDLTEYASFVRVLATIGTQMASFVHEARGLLGGVTVLERGLRELHQHVDAQGAKRLRQTQVTLSDLRLNLERQLSYLSDVAVADARRRRSRQNLHDAFERVRVMFEKQAAAREIKIVNKIPAELKTRPMFASEIRTTFINLLSNAIRAAGKRGRIVASAGVRDGSVWVRLENTGRRVATKDFERWFRPFETTSIDVENDLAQGMGLGLPITRATLETYNGDIRFVPPSGDFSTAVLFSIPQ